MEGFHEEVKRLTIECDNPLTDRWLSLPKPKFVAIDKRNIIKARYWPSRNVNGKIKSTRADAKLYEVTNPLTFEERYPNGLYKNIHHRRTIPAYFEVLYHDRSTEQFDRESLIERCGEGFVIMLEELQKGDKGNGKKKRGRPGGDEITNTPGRGVGVGKSQKGSGNKERGTPGGDGSTPKPGKVRFAPVPSKSSKSRYWGTPHNMPLVPIPCYYNQGKFETCVFTAFASALHYGGLVEPAEEVYRLGISTFLDVGKPIQSLNWHVCNKMKLKFDVRRMKSYQLKLEYLQTVSKRDGTAKNRIFLCVLESTDGCRDHAVSILNGLIFDGNEDNAMPLLKENLDFCCSDSTGVSKFRQILIAYSYESKLLNARMKKLYP